MPTFQNVGTTHDESVGTPKVPFGTLTENLLRNILCLTPDQQHELVSDLIAGSITTTYTPLNLDLQLIYIFSIQLQIKL